MKAIKTITIAICWVAMAIGVLALIDAVQLAQTCTQLIVYSILPGAMFLCGYLGRKVINENYKEL